MNEGLGPFFKPTPPLSGNTLWVDSINGNDSSGARGNALLPFLTVAAALAAASSGDTVVIRPGTYAVTASILKNGVNIFAWGATITMTGVALQAGQLSDGGSAITCNVYGGNYSRTESVDSGDGVHARIVGVSNASSNIKIWAESITFSSTMSSTGNYCVWQEAGTMFLDCTLISATASSGNNAVGVAWLNGAGYVRSQNINTTLLGVYSQVDATPTGDFFVECDVIDTSSGVSGTNAAIWQNGSDSTAAIWIRASVVKCQATSAARSVLTSASKANKLYLTTQKIFGLARFDGSGLTYITADKWETLANGGVSQALFIAATAGTIFVDCRHYDPVSFTGSAIRNLSGTADLRIGAGYFTGGSGSAFGLRCDGGTTRSNGLRIDTSANSGTNPVSAGGGVVILTNCTLVAEGSADSITAGSAQNVVAMASYTNRAVNGNVTITVTGGLTVDSDVV
jgi:hypothetical protein